MQPMSRSESPAHSQPPAITAVPRFGTKQVHLAPVKRATMSELITALAADAGISRTELCSRSRARRILRARQAAMAALRAIRRSDGRPRYSLERISHAFGFSSHTSALRGIAAHQRREAAGAPSTPAP